MSGERGPAERPLLKAGDRVQHASGGPFVLVEDPFQARDGTWVVAARSERRGEEEEEHGLLLCKYLTLRPMAPWWVRPLCWVGLHEWSNSDIGGQMVRTCGCGRRQVYERAAPGKAGGWRDA